MFGGGFETGALEAVFGKAVVAGVEAGGEAEDGGLDGAFEGGGYDQADDGVVGERGVKGGGSNHSYHPITTKLLLSNCQLSPSKNRFQAIAIRVGLDAELLEAGRSF